MSKVKDVIVGAVAKKLREKKGKLTGTVVLDISGPEGGKWTLDCDNATVKDGDTANPAVRILMMDADFIAMIEGSLNPASALFSGKLKIEGDMAMASKLAMAVR